MSLKKVVIIGSGYGGLASASIFAQAGFKVTVLEKNSDFGGRARLLTVGKNKKGEWEETSPKKAAKKNNYFRFDLGPSWYLMPDIFEHYYELLGENISDHLNLVRLNPSYQIIFKDTLLGSTKMYGNLKKDAATFEAFEPGAGRKVTQYVESSKRQYKIALDKFLYKNYDSMADFFTKEMITEGRKLNVLSKMQKYVSKRFTSPQIQKILQYHLVFLGAGPSNAPALYNILSHVDMNQGVFYPMGGIYKVTESLVNLAKKRGVKLLAGQEVEKIIVKNGRAAGVKAGGKTYEADIVISNADIHHTETKLLDPEHRHYSKLYWRRRVMAPSALLLYLGIEGTYENLEHHNLVFSQDWNKNFKEIFKGKKFPKDPSFYVCNPNKTDPSTAPIGHENLFVLVPIAAGTKYTKEQLEDFTAQVLDTMEKTLHLTGLRDRLVYQKSYCVVDFERDYHSYKGTALGFSHTLRQTAVFRPKNQHQKIPNLLFAGAGTTPGIGMPMCLISAELAYKRVLNDRSGSPLKNITKFDKATL